MAIEQLSLEDLIFRLHEVSGKADGNVVFTFKDGMFITYVWADGIGIMEQEATDLFLSFKKHYQKIFKKPVLEKPGEYLLGSFNQIVQKVAAIAENITVVPLKGNRFEVSVRLEDKNKVVMAMGSNVNHALVFLLREFIDLGFE